MFVLSLINFTKDSSTVVLLDCNILPNNCCVCQTLSPITFNLLNGATCYRHNACVRTTICIYIFILTQHPFYSRVVYGIDVQLERTLHFLFANKFSNLVQATCIMFRQSLLIFNIFLHNNSFSSSHEFRITVNITCLFLSYIVLP